MIIVIDIATANNLALELVKFLNFSERGVDLSPTGTPSIIQTRVEEYYSDLCIFDC